HDPANLLGHFANVLFAVSLAPLVVFEIVHVLAERPLHVVIECVDATSCPTLSLDDKRVEHALSRPLVRRQRNPSVDAVLIAEPAPPLLRFDRDLFPGLRVTLLDRFLVQTRHCFQISKTPPTPGG